MSRTVGYRELKADGFRNIHEVNLKSRGRGLWFEVRAYSGVKDWSPRRQEHDVLMLRQSKGKWHSFWKTVNVTGSGHTPLGALGGGLGDVIDTDQDMKRYCDLVLSAPERLSKEYLGLYAAQSQCWHEQERGGPILEDDDDDL